MTTFSQLIDEMVLETKRPDMINEIATYLNQTIREIHFEPGKGNVVFYDSNRKEDQVIADVDSGLVWPIPNPTVFQGIEAVEFPGQLLGKDGFATEVSPGPRIKTMPFVYYRSGQAYVFGGAVGYGGVNASINISWYEYPKSLKYKRTGTREATYDVETGWTYYDLTGSGGVNWTLLANQEAAQDRVTNWVILRWADVLREGLRAKIYKRLSDQLRATTSYSLYAQLRQGIFTGEAAKLQAG
jgi:hypothetical protein